MNVKKTTYHAKWRNMTRSINDCFSFLRYPVLNKKFSFRPFKVICFVFPIIFSKTQKLKKVKAFNTNNLWDAMRMKALLEI